LRATDVKPVSVAAEHFAWNLEANPGHVATRPEVQ